MTKCRLILLGGLSPLIGLLVFWIQLQVRPSGYFLYVAVQTVISVIFLGYFFICGDRFSRKQHKKIDALYFFLVPILLVIVNVVFQWQIQSNMALAVALSGVMAPFHYVIHYAFFSADTYALIPNALPVLVCWIVFQLGGKVSRFRQRRGKM